MYPEPDAFITAVDTALERLARDEGKRVSMREVLRRTDADDAMRAKVFYHLNRQRDWPRGHNVPPDVVEILARGLPIDATELARAAQVAAGYDVAIPAQRVSGVDLRRLFARFVGDAEIPPEELLDLSAHINARIADELRRRAGNDRATA